MYTVLCSRDVFMCRIKLISESLSTLLRHTMRQQFHVLFPPLMALLSFISGLMLDLLMHACLVKALGA